MTQLDKKDLSTLGAMEMVVLLLIVLAAFGLVLDQAANHNIWPFITVIMVFTGSLLFLAWILNFVWTRVADGPEDDEDAAEPVQVGFAGFSDQIDSLSGMGLEDSGGNK